MLDELRGPEDIDKVTDALIECTTGEEFIERVLIGSRLQAQLLGQSGTGRETAARLGI